MEESPKFKKTKKEATGEIVDNIFLNFSTQVFRDLMRTNPDTAKAIEPDFDEYIDTWMKIKKESPSGNYSVKEIEKRIPNNQWAKMMKQVAREILPSTRRDFTKQDMIEFEEEIKKIQEGEDLN